MLKCVKVCQSVINQCKMSKIYLVMHSLAQICTVPHILALRSTKIFPLGNIHRTVMKLFICFLIKLHFSPCIHIYIIVQAVEYLYIRARVEPSRIRFAQFPRYRSRSLSVSDSWVSRMKHARTLVLRRRTLVEVDPCCYSPSTRDRGSHSFWLY